MRLGRSGAEAMDIRDLGAINREEILTKLKGGATTAAALHVATGLSIRTIQGHLRALRAAGLVKVASKGVYEATKRRKA